MESVKSKEAAEQRMLKKRSWFPVRWSVTVLVCFLAVVPLFLIFLLSWLKVFLDHLILFKSSVVIYLYVANCLYKNSQKYGSYNTIFVSHINILFGHFLYGSLIHK